MSRIKLAVLLALLAAGGVLYQIGRSQQPIELSYMEKAARIRFPKGMSEYTVAHPREFCFAGRMKLPESQAANFIRRSGFLPETQFPLNNDFAAEPKMFGNPLALTNWHGLKGRNSSQRWEFAYNPQGHFLYFVVLYPDMSGDPPP